MNVIFRGRFDKNHFLSAIHMVKGIHPPQNTKLYIIDSIDSCPTIAPDLPRVQKIIFKRFCDKERISFSYSFGKYEIVIIWVTPDKEFLRTNKRAVAGLIAHELMHTVLRKKGLDKQLVDSYLSSYESNYSILNAIEMPRPRLRSMFDKIGSEAVMTLKEIYANSELIKRGYGDLLLEYYMYKTGGDKFCPIPMFYTGGVRSATLNEIENGVLFQLALFPARIPFQKYDKPKAKRLIAHIEECYERGISEISREFNEVIVLTLEDFEPTPAFQKEFYSTVFMKVYKLLVESARKKPRPVR